MIVKNRISKLINSSFLPHIVAPIILISPVIFSGKALFWGTPATQFVPWWKFSFDTVLAGHLPLWNPQLGMGAPLIANYQSALFYPPNWLYFISYVIGGLPVLAWTQAIIVTGHLILSSVGMSLFCRRMGLGKLAQSICGLAFGLSGYLVSRAWFSSVNAVISWLPWVLMYAHEMVLTKRKSSWIKLVIVLSLQLLAGHAQLTWYTWLLAIAWILHINFNMNEHLDQKLSLRLLALANHLMKFGTAICVSIGITAVQLIPTAEYLMQSQRATAANYESAMTYSFWPWRLLGLIAPNLFGNPAYSDYWGYGNFWEDSIYVGLLPIILASVYLFKQNKKNGDGFNQETRRANEQNSGLSYSPNKIFFIFMILASIFLALGQNSAIFPFLYDHIPTFDMFRAPTRFSIWMVFLLSLCAGYGVDQWRRPVERGLYWTRLGTAGAFAISLGAGLGWWLLADVAVDFKPTFVPAIVTTGLLGLVCGLLALSAPKEGSDQNEKRTFWNWAVILFVCGDLLYMGWGLNPGIDLGFYSESPDIRITSEIKNIKGRVLLLPRDESNLRFEEFFRPESFKPAVEWNHLRKTLLPNINLLDGISMVNNYDPLVPRQYEHWMEKIDQIDLNSKPEILDIMGVSIVVEKPEDAVGRINFNFRHMENRTYWVPCARNVPTSEAALESVFSGEIDLKTTLVVENNVPEISEGCNVPNALISIIEETPNYVEIWVDSDAPGWLVLSDVWYPGWKAWIDGEKSNIYRANYAFKAVEVPEGDHIIKFSYQPLSFYFGVGFTVITVLGLWGYAYWIKRK